MKSKDTDKQGIWYCARCGQRQIRKRVNGENRYYCIGCNKGDKNCTCGGSFEHQW